MVTDGEEAKGVNRCYLCHDTVSAIDFVLSLPYHIIMHIYIHFIIFRSYSDEHESSTDPADGTHKFSKCAYDEPGLRNTHPPGNVCVC